MKVVSSIPFKKKKLTRVSPERAKLPTKPQRPELAPLLHPLRKAELLVVHAIASYILILSAFSKPVTLLQAVGLALICGSFHFLFGLFLLRFHREEVDQFSKCFAAASISIITLLIFRLILYSGFDPEILPLSVATLLFVLVLSQRFAFSASSFILILIGLYLYAAGMDPAKPVLILGSGAAIASFTVGRIRKRSTLIKAGLFIGIAQLIVGLGIMLLKGNGFEWSKPIFLELLWYFGQGIMVGFLVSGLLPVVEFMFGVTTDVSLLELSNQNEQPVLKKLLIEAPGTFHHSFIVGLLSEAAAERIGAHGLLCRVGAYFHDIGKMVKPEYYAENTDLTKSKHEALSPEMSALVIASHLKDSLELADYYDLPPCLRAFMTEHHGTSRIEYFYNLALEKAQEKGIKVDEASFRYPGPKPQSKETAIVMLADTIEAAVRSQQNPTPSRIKSIVNDLIWKRLQEGELDESPLTLRDIKEIGEAFTSVLTGIYHSRPAYPKTLSQDANSQ